MTYEAQLVSTLHSGLAAGHSFVIVLSLIMFNAKPERYAPLDNPSAASEALYLPIPPETSSHLEGR